MPLQMAPYLLKCQRAMKSNDESNRPLLVSILKDANIIVVVIIITDHMRTGENS
jgi:hypothetical protein